MASSSDQYKTLGVSTSHLTIDDLKALEEIADDLNCNMILSRDTGWFVKLYDEPFDNFHKGMSESFNKILIGALSAGYRMVEFDCDATEYKTFKVFAH